MNSHVKIPEVNTDLSRRSFLVGTAAAGLALGYSAVRRWEKFKKIDPFWR